MTFRHLVNKAVKKEIKKEDTKLEFTMGKFDMSQITNNIKKKNEKKNDS